MLMTLAIQLISNLKIRKCRNLNLLIQGANFLLNKMVWDCGSIKQKLVVQLMDKTYLLFQDHLEVEALKSKIIQSKQMHNKIQSESQRKNIRKLYKKQINKKWLHKKLNSIWMYYDVKCRNIIKTRTIYKCSQLI